MEAFRNEIKRIRVQDAPAEPPSDLPFILLGRHPSDGMGAGETWIVRGWEDAMGEALHSAGARIREVVHLDLEEGFVELLRAARPEVWGARNGRGAGLLTPGAVSSRPEGGGA